MKITIERNLLLRALAHVSRVVERRNAIPILSNVLLRAGDGALRLRATDLDIEVTESVAADVAEPGATTVPAALLHDIVRKLPEGAQLSLDLADGGQQVQLRSGRSRFVLGTLPETDFPDLAVGEMTHSFEMPAADLERLFERVQFAISTEETRYYLNGVYLHTLANEAGTALRAVATDGHRLARMEMPAPAGSEGMPSVIVPRKAVTEIQKLVADGAETVRIDVSPAKVRLAFGEVVFVSKLIDGTFPDYERVIPKGNDKPLLVAGEALAKAVDRVSTVSMERGRAVKLSADDNRLTLSVNNVDSGSATEELEVEYASDPIEIGFNARYLLDIINQVGGDVARLMMANPGAPTVIEDPKEPSAVYVLMPMRV